MSVCDPTVNSTEGSEGLPLVELDAFGMLFLWPFIGFQGPNQPAALHFAAWGHGTDAWNQGTGHWPSINHVTPPPPPLKMQNRYPQKTCCLYSLFLEKKSG